MPRYLLSGIRRRAPRMADAATVAKLLHLPRTAIHAFRVVRRSLDARKKPELYYELAAEFETDTPIDVALAPPLQLSEASAPRGPELLLPRLPREAQVAIVGSGPSGLFAALALVDAGVRVVLLERGDPAEDRYRKVMRFWKNGDFDPESNVQFGEGGAGTFSDGKLTCGKRLDKVLVVLETLHRFGAPDSILVDAKPHVGTDRLVVVLRNIRRHLIENGAIVRYRARVVDLIRRGPDGPLGALVLDTGEIVPAELSVFALGHSARDTMEMLNHRGVAMQAKPFSMGVRIEHPQELIDRIQYGVPAATCGVMPADYKQAAQVGNGRGVYSFCMCPGGEVIACSSEAGGVVTNGMSRYKRASGFANSGIVVQTREEDFAGMKGPELLRGMRFQREVERRAFQAAGGNYAAPAIRVLDFLAGRDPGPLPASTYGPGLTPARFDGIFPEAYLTALSDALRAFDRKMRGFVCAEALLIGPETRTSSPVRIERDDWCESTTLKGLFPAGEGAGFAGGIVSAALDGLRVARQVRARLAGEELPPEKQILFRGPEY